MLGRNGAGKTSLMRLITGEETPNSGEIIRSDSVVVRRLIQEVPDDITGTVLDVMHRGPCAPTAMRKNGRPTSAWRIWPRRWSCRPTTISPRSRAD